MQNSTFTKFEEYKLFVEDTAKFSERRQTLNNTYVAVNSIVLTAVSFLVKDAGFQRLWQAIVVILVLSAGIVICNQWKRMIRKYKALVGFRIRHLRKIEELPEMSGCYRMYHLEDELYPCDEKGVATPNRGLNFSDGETWLPTIFQATYITFSAGIIGIRLLKPELLG